MKNLKLNDCLTVVGGSKDHCSDADKSKCEAQEAKKHAKEAADIKKEQLKNDTKNLADEINEKIHKKLD